MSSWVHAIGWDGLTAIATSVTAAVAGCAAAAAGYAAWYAKGQLDEAKKARDDAARPYVVAAFERSGVGSAAMDFVVRNIGQRPATNLMLTMTPAPTRTREEPEGFKLADAKMLTEPTSMLAPGQELRAFFDGVGPRMQSDLPMVYRLSMAYAGEDTSEEGTPVSEDRPYKSIAVLDFAALAGTLETRVYGMHDLAKATREISSTLKNASALGRDGRLATDTSVERRTAKQQRDAAEEEERKQERESLLELFGHVAPGRDSPPDPGTS